MQFCGCRTFGVNLSPARRAFSREILMGSCPGKLNTHAHDHHPPTRFCYAYTRQISAPVRFYRTTLLRGLVRAIVVLFARPSVTLETAKHITASRPSSPSIEPHHASYSALKITVSPNGVTTRTIWKLTIFDQYAATNYWKRYDIRIQ